MTYDAEEKVVFGPMQRPHAAAGFDEEVYLSNGLAWRFRPQWKATRNTSTQTHI